MSHLVPGAMHDFLWDGVDLVVHLHTTPLPVSHPYQQNPEVGSSQVQGQEVSFLWKTDQEDDKLGHPHLATARQSLMHRPLWVKPFNGS